MSHKIIPSRLHAGLSLTIQQQLVTPFFKVHGIPLLTVSFVLITFSYSVPNTPNNIEKRSAKMSAPLRTIVVVGATGNQGIGVVRALLGSETAGGNPWLVRAITRDPNSVKAKRFLADNQTSDGRLALVAGHVYDKSSLQDAFTGAYGVFGLTSEYYPGRVLEKEEEMQHEIEAGRNIILAARACGIKHFVFSSLPDMVKTTKG